ncbi:MAG: polysaccharide export protein [Paramuribaculum sp.]|nr:polysaccharide export protein [Paramuribaculum sp.]
MILKTLRNGLVLTAVALLASCSAPKIITYVQGFEQGDTQVVNAQYRMTLQPEDKLSIVVSSKDPELAQVFNLTVAQLRAGQSTGASSSGSNGVSAFTVSPNGDIVYPILGKLHVAGLTRMEVAKMIEDRLLNEGYLKDPVVTVEFLNATVSVLGEVSSPGEYPITRDNMTLLQAISKAGDLKITGMRKNVLVMREENGKEVAYRVDLTDTKALMESPAYYLQQNDVVYVEPNDMTKRQSVVNGTSVLTPSFWISIASFLITLTAILVK